MLFFHSSLIGVAALSAARVECTPYPPPTTLGGQGTCDLDVPASPLPAPPSTLSLKFVGLGVGTQNYSCVPGEAGPSLTSSRGAVATLFDITDVLCATKTQNVFSIDLSSLRKGNRRLGQHYFTADLVPTFDLNYTHPRAFFSAKKSANVAAPGSGTISLPAIDWLYLVADGTKPNSGDVAAAYRVKTMGGVPPSDCAGNITVVYTAEYWFYG